MTLWFGDFDEVWSSTSVLLLSTSQYWMVHSHWLYSHSKDWCTAKQQGCVCFLSRVRHPLDLFAPVFTNESQVRCYVSVPEDWFFTDFQSFRTQWRPCFHVFHILNVGVFWCSTSSYQSPVMCLSFSQEMAFQSEQEAAEQVEEHWLDQVFHLMVNGFAWWDMTTKCHHHVHANWNTVSLITWMSCV